MGWSGGTDIVSDLVPVLQAWVPDLKARQKIYECVIESCESLDWDNKCEVQGKDPVLDEVLENMGMFFEEDDEYDD